MWLWVQRLKRLKTQVPGTLARSAVHFNCQAHSVGSAEQPPKSAVGREKRLSLPQPSSKVKLLGPMKKIFCDAETLGFARCTCGSSCIGSSCVRIFCASAFFARVLSLEMWPQRSLRGGRWAPKVTLGILDEGSGLLGHQLEVHGLVRSGSCSARLIHACSRILRSQGTPPSRLPKWPSVYAECLSSLPLETPKLRTAPPLGMRIGSPPLTWDSP